MIKEKRTVKVKVSANELVNTLLIEADPMVSAGDIEAFDLDQADSSFVVIKAIEQDLSDYKEQRLFNFTKQQLIDDVISVKYAQAEASDIDAIVEESPGNFLVVLKEKLFAEYQGE